MPELRSDKLTDTWVLLAEERQARPREFRLRAEPREAGPCPFCPGHEGMTPPETYALRDGPDPAGWRVRAVPNKFPLLGPMGTPVALGHVLRSMEGVGVHEVIVDEPAHAARLADRSPQQWEDLARAMQHRMLALGQDPRVRYVYAFKNQGPASGASLAHPHTQVVALPLEPDRVRREVQALAEHHRLAAHCLVEDLLQEELDAKLRVVEERDGLVALCPFAARFPYEMLLLPRAHAPRFEAAPDAEVAAFGRALGRCLVRLERVLAASGLESYHFGIHTAPARGRRERYHWHCEVAPSLHFYAGFEKGTGVFVNHLGPERSAEALRDAP